MSRPRPNAPNPYAPNPYAAPTSRASLRPGARRELADRLERFLAFLIDFFIGLPLSIIQFVLMAAGGDSGAMIGMIIGIVGGVALIVVQIVFLVNYSASIGKRVMKIFIADYVTGAPANWVQTIVMRYLVNGLICVVPCLGFIYALVDICFIFRDDRRCIHDLLANTVVLKR